MRDYKSNVINSKKKKKVVAIRKRIDKKKKIHITRLNELFSAEKKIVITFLKKIVVKIIWVTAKDFNIFYIYLLCIACMFLGGCMSLINFLIIHCYNVDMGNFLTNLFVLICNTIDSYFGNTDFIKKLTEMSIVEPAVGFAEAPVEEVFAEIPIESGDPVEESVKDEGSFIQRNFWYIVGGGVVLVCILGGGVAYKCGCFSSPAVSAIIEVEGVPAGPEVGPVGFDPGFSRELVLMKPENGVYRSILAPNRIWVEQWQHIYQMADANPIGKESEIKVAFGCRSWEHFLCANIDTMRENLRLEVNTLPPKSGECDTFFRQSYSRISGGASLSPEDLSVFKAQMYDQQAANISRISYNIDKTQKVIDSGRSMRLTAESFGLYQV